MLTLLFFAMMIAVFGELIVFAFKAAWGITKVMLTLVFLPIALLFMFIGGLVNIAIPILAIIGIISLIERKTV